MSYTKTQCKVGNTIIALVRFLKSETASGIVSAFTIAEVEKSLYASFPQFFSPILSGSRLANSSKDIFS